MKYTIILYLIFAVDLLFAIDINLPYTNNFETNNDFINLYYFNSGQAVVMTWDAFEGWENTGCVRGQIQNHGDDVQSGLGEIHWGAAQPRINIGWLVYFGPNYWQVIDEQDWKVLLLWGTTDRPKINENSYYSNYRTWAPCRSAGGNCQFWGGGEWPDGTDPFKIGDWLNQWLWVEFEVIQGTHTRLYIYTQDGTFNGVYITNNDGGTSTTGINLLFGYWEGAHNITNDSYFKIDMLKIDTQQIGPPPGFFNFNQPPNTPQGLKVEK